MNAQDENSGLSVECKVVAEKNGYFVSDQSHYFVLIAKFVNKLNQIEKSGRAGWSGIQTYRSLTLQNRNDLLIPQSP